MSVLNKLRQPRFQLLVLAVIAISVVGIVYFQRRQVNLTSGACPVETAEINQSIVRKSDQTTWCLSGLTEQAIQWQWSPDGERFAYALQDKKDPTRQLSPREGYTEVANLNWYVMNSDGSRHKRFSAPDPYQFQFSPDGQYADYVTYDDYGHTKHEIVSIRTSWLICRFETYNGWYSESKPPCNTVQLKDGTLWNIQAEVNRVACVYYVTYWKWDEDAEENGCRELLAGTELVPTVTPIPSPYPTPTHTSTATPYP
ncbi:MAG: hypothetical protein P8183_19750 [Anaerolineae bacterium]